MTRACLACGCTSIHTDGRCGVCESDRIGVATAPALKPWAGPLCSPSDPCAAAGCVHCADRETVAAMADEVDRLYLGEFGEPTEPSRTLSLEELARVRELAACGCVEIDGVKVPPFDSVALSPDVHRGLTPALEVDTGWPALVVESDARLPERSMSLRRMGVPVAALIEDRDGSGWFLVVL